MSDAPSPNAPGGSAGRLGAVVLILYLVAAALLAGWIGKRCELAYFPQHRHAVLFCAGVDALRVWPPFEQPWSEPEVYQPML